MILRHLVIGLHNYNIKEVESLEIFKREIKNWICDDCPCRLHLFFYKQSIFDPRPENCLSFSKKLAPKIV